MKRAATFVACTVILAACANDFDALFDGTKSGSDGGKPTTSSSGEPSSDDDVADDDDVPPVFDSGTPPVDAKTSLDPTTACGAKQATCTDVRKAGGPPDFAVTNACTGCGCSCPSFDCDQADGLCDTSCNGGATCIGTCRFQDVCGFTVTASAASYTCTGQQFTACKLSCTQGSVCNFDCSNARRCTVSCEAGSACTVKMCVGDSCRFDACPNQKSCADGTVVCGEATCK